MKCKKNLLVLLSLITILSIIFNFNFYEEKTYAYDQALQADINGDKLDERLILNNNQFEIQTSEGNVIYSESNCEIDTVFKNIFLINDADNKLEIVVSKKSTDTSGELSYSIYEYKDGSINEIKTYSGIYKGIIQVIDNVLIQTSPIYNSSDSNAEPSSLEKKYYTLKDGSLSLVKSEVMANKRSNIVQSGTYYKNPSKNEIEKIIKHVAYEKGIPSVILEAIAWTESNGIDYDNNNTANWRQFTNGSPLISYDGGIGIMQVTSYDSTDTDYVNRLKYDIEFNIREGARILLSKWARGFSSGTDKIPQVGNGQPTLLEHWYYAIWAYNGYSNINNPVNCAENNSIPYQKKVVGFVNNIFSTPMIDLYEYNSSLFQLNVLPTENILEVTNAHSGDIKQKNTGIKYVVASSGQNSLSIKNDSWATIGSFNQGDIVEISKGPLYYNGYFRYYVKGTSKEGWVAGNYIKPAGDVNYDETVNIYDLVKISKEMDGTNSYEYLKYDANMDGYTDLNDIALTSENYETKFYINNIN